MKTIIGTILTIAIIYFVCLIPLNGWHRITGEGEHTGFITATETTGLIFRTYTVYLKTNTQSTQEDQYCVVNNDVFNKLKDLQETKENITVKFINWAIEGVKNCDPNATAGVIIEIK